MTKVLNKLRSLACGGLLLSVATFAAGNNYELALQAFNEGKIETAYIHLKNALQQDEQNLPAKLLLAKVLIKKNMFASAEQEINDAIAYGVDKNLAIESLGTALLLQQKFDKALHFAERMSLNTKGKLAFNLIKAKAYRGLKQPQKASEIYQQILSQYPNHVEALLGLARIYVVNKQLKEADLLLQKVANFDENNAILWQIKGLLAQQKADEAAAIEAYKKSVALDNNNIVSRRLLVSAYLALNEYTLAEIELTEALAQAPKDPQLQFMKNTLLRQQGDEQAANNVLIGLSNQLAAIDEQFLLSNPELLLLDAMASYGQQNWKQAIVKFTKYIEQNQQQNDLNAIVLLADAYTKVGEGEKALELLEQHEAKIVKRKEFALVLTGLYLQFNKHFKADYLLQTLRAEYPNDEDVVILSAKYWDDIKQHTKAYQYLQQHKEFNSERYRYTKALVAFNVQQFQQSLNLVDSLIATAPEHIEYALLKVQLLLRTHQTEKAAQLITQLAEKYPRNKEVKYRLAAMNFAQRKLEQAEKLATSLVESDPSDNNSALLLADILAAKGETDRTVKILERLSKQDSVRITALQKLTSLYANNNQIEQAIQTVERILSTNRLNIAALFLKSRLLIQNRDKKSALHTVNILKGLLTDDAKQFFDLAQLQQQLADYEGAEYSYQRASELAPKNFNILIARAKLAIKMRKISNAKQIVKQAKQQGFANNLYLLVIQGDIAFAEKDLYLAYRFYANALKKDSLNPVPLIKLTQISRHNALTNKLTKLLETLVEQYPDEAFLRHTLADHLLEHKQFEKAKFAYQVLLTKNIPPGKAAIALNNLATIYIRDKEFQLAESTAQEAVKILPNSAPIVDTLGWSMVMNNKVEAGLKYLRKAYSLSSSLPEVQYHIAYALHQLNRNTEAKKVLQDLLMLSPKFDELPQAQALLKTL